MKNKFLLILLIFNIVFSLPATVFSQKSLDFELTCQVHTVYPPLAISRQNLEEANSIGDLNKFFKLSWIKEFIGVEIKANYQGKSEKVISNNELITIEQKELMGKADYGTDISIDVLYMPNNTLSHKEEKVFDFTFVIDPDHPATFIGGDEALNQYLQDSVITKIDKSSFKKYGLTAVNFTINEEGIIVDATMFESSKDKQIDALLLDAVRNMPCWQAASYADGTKVKQKMVLAIGDRSSCVVNLLNIRDPSNY